MFHRKEHRCRPAGNADLVVNVFQVVRDRPLADDQSLGNLAIGVSLCHLLQDLDLPAG